MNCDISRGNGFQEIVGKYNLLNFSNRRKFLVSLDGVADLHAEIKHAESLQNF